MNERSLLVLGLGNVLLEDDGLGSAAIACLLERFEAPRDVRVLDGGTLGLSLLPYLELADAVILVDAIGADAAPGTFVRLDGDEVAPAVATRLSPHQVGVSDMLDCARWLGSYPSDLILVGLVPASMNLGVGLSPMVRAALPRLIEHIVAEAQGLGFLFHPKTVGNRTPFGRPGADVARLAGMP